MWYTDAYCVRYGPSHRISGFFTGSIATSEAGVRERGDGEEEGEGEGLDKKLNPGTMSRICDSIAWRLFPVNVLGIPLKSMMPVQEMSDSRNVPGFNRLLLLLLLALLANICTPAESSAIRSGHLMMMNMTAFRFVSCLRMLLSSLVVFDIHQGVYETCLSTELKY